MAEITNKATALSESISKILKDDSTDLVSDEIAIAWLDTATACLLTKTRMKLDETWQAVGSEIRQDFQNTIEGKAELEKAVPEPYLTAILAVWDSNSVKSSEEKIEVEGEIENE